jgi:transposase
MAKRYTDEFRRDAVRIATTSGLTRPQFSSDLGVGLSTLNKWVQQHQHDDLMSGPHDDAEKENTRLRKEVQLLREEREVLKKAVIFFSRQSPFSWFASKPLPGSGLGSPLSMPRKKNGL